MPENKSNFKEISVGDKLSETQYYTVVSSVHGKDSKSGNITVQNERGFEFNVSSGIVEEGMYSASQFNEVRDVTRTELIEILANVGDTVFTANFHKQPTATSINDAIESANKGKIIPIKELKKLVKDAYKGEERTLVGYLIRVETGFGRSSVIDLQASVDTYSLEHDSRIRQIDHRSLNWIIYKNVKYQQKK